MDKIPQKGIIISTAPITPHKGVIGAVPQKKQDPEKAKWELNKEHLPETNKVLEPTMSMASIPALNIPRKTDTKTAPISVKKEITVPNPQKTPIPVASEVLKEKPMETGDVSDTPTLRTYKKDVASTITNQKTSLVRMVLEEQKGRQKKEREESPRTGKNLSLIIFSVFFFIATIGVVYYAFFRSSGTNQLLSELNIAPFINVEVSQEFAIEGKSKKNIIAEIQEEITSEKPRLDTIKNIFFTETTSSQTPDGVVKKKRLVTASELFNKLEIPVPSVINRTIKDDFMFGYHTFEGNQPFLVLKTDYYDNAFSGMLTWESTMSSELVSLFGNIGKEDLKGRTWRDVVTKNKDTRVLNNFDGSVALVYMFKDQGTLIITTNNSTLFEISRRLDLSAKKSGN